MPERIRPVIDVDHEEQRDGITNRAWKEVVCGKYISDELGRRID